MSTYKEIFEDCIDSQVPMISTPSGKVTLSHLLYNTPHYRDWFNVFVAEFEFLCNSCAKEFYTDVGYEDLDNDVLCDKCVPSKIRDLVLNTRARIAIRWGMGYKSIYCHYDGYEEGLGNTLRECLNTKKQAIELINLGDCISVFGNKETERFKFIPYAKSCYGTGKYSWKDVRPRISKNFGALVELTRKTGAKFLYIFEGGEEWQSTRYTRIRKLHYTNKLTEEVK